MHIAPLLTSAVAYFREDYPCLHCKRIHECENLYSVEDFYDREKELKRDGTKEEDGSVFVAGCRVFLSYVVRGEKWWKHFKKQYPDVEDFSVFYKECNIYRYNSDCETEEIIKQEVEEHNFLLDNRYRKEIREFISVLFG